MTLHHKLLLGARRSRVDVARSLVNTQIDIVGEDAVIKEEAHAIARTRRRQTQTHGEDGRVGSN